MAMLSKPGKKISCNQGPRKRAQGGGGGVPVLSLFNLALLMLTGLLWSSGSANA